MSNVNIVVLEHVYIKVLVFSVPNTKTKIYKMGVFWSTEF